MYSYLMKWLIVSVRTNMCKKKNGEGQGAPQVDIVDQEIVTLFDVLLLRGNNISEAKK